MTCVSVIIDRDGVGSDAILGIFTDSLTAVREFRKLKGQPHRLLSLTLMECDEVYYGKLQTERL